MARTIQFTQTLVLIRDTKTEHICTLCAYENIPAYEKPCRECKHTKDDNFVMKK